MDEYTVQILSILIVETHPVTSATWQSCFMLFSSLTMDYNNTDATFAVADAVVLSQSMAAYTIFLMMLPQSWNSRH